jgi:replicative DNA helicase
MRRTRNQCPSKEDLYHSGSLEQWSHTIALLWKPEIENFPRMICLILAKQKNGPTGIIPLGWNPEFLSYSDPDEHCMIQYMSSVKEKMKEDY